MYDIEDAEIERALASCKSWHMILVLFNNRQCRISLSALFDNYWIITETDNDKVIDVGNVFSSSEVAKIHNAPYRLRK